MNHTWTMYNVSSIPIEMTFTYIDRPDVSLVFNPQTYVEGLDDRTKNKLDHLADAGLVVFRWVSIRPEPKSKHNWKEEGF